MSSNEKKYKIQGGTVEHGERSLCDSCRHALIVEGPSINDRFVQCAKMNDDYGHAKVRVPFHVHHCSGYENRATTTLWEMKKIAWELRTDKSGRKIGFMSPQDLRDAKEKEGKSEGTTKYGRDPDDAIWDPLKKEEVY